MHAQQLEQSFLSAQFNPARAITEEDPKYRANPELKDRIHCLVAVLPANTISMIDEQATGQMRAVRERKHEIWVSHIESTSLFTKTICWVNTFYPLGS